MTTEVTLPTQTIRRSTAAFTLLEILVVIAILGLLVGLVVSKLGDSLGRSQVDVAKIFVTTTLKLPIQQYRMDVRNLPSSADGIMSLITKPGSGADGWRGPYIEGTKVPLDPWNQPYEYLYPGKFNPTGYDLWSKGPDLISGTADDIGNWETGTQSESEGK